MDSKSLEMNLERLFACPICGQPDCHIKYESDICKCRSCKTLFRNFRPARADIASSCNTGITYDTWHQETNSKNWNNLWTRILRFVGENFHNTFPHNPINLTKTANLKELRDFF